LKGYKLGKKAPRVDSRTLKFSTYRTTSLPAPPAATTWSAQVPAVPGWGMDLNDTLGDCTVAALAHMILLWTANANPPAAQPTDAQIQAAYAAVSPNDDGADLLTVLNYARQNGLGSNKPLAFLAVDYTSQQEVQEAVDLFGAVYLGVELPAFIADYTEQNPPWVLPSTETSYPPGNPNDGHCIPIVDYDADGCWVVTWGQKVRMSWDFLSHYGDEAFAVLDASWIRKTGLSPSGFNLDQLIADLSAISVEAPPPTAPPAPPVSWWQELLARLKALLHIK
jgi:hypothetical protein